MTFRSNDKLYTVVLSDEVSARLVTLIAEDPKRETGGIIVGYYSHDLKTAIVTHATRPPSDSIRGRRHFMRGIGGLTGLLRRLWNAPQREHYIGEWHYHPADYVEPSQEDLTQMREIATNSKYQCKEPIMIICGRPKDDQSKVIRVFVFPLGDGLELML